MDIFPKKIENHSARQRERTKTGANVLHKGYYPGSVPGTRMLFKHCLQPQAKTNQTCQEIYVSSYSMSLIIIEMKK